VFEADLICKARMKWVNQGNIAITCVRCTIFFKKFKKLYLLLKQQIKR